MRTKQKANMNPLLKQSSCLLVCKHWLLTFNDFELDWLTPEKFNELTMAAILHDFPFVRIARSASPPTLYIHLYRPIGVPVRRAVKIACMIRGTGGPSFEINRIPRPVTFWRRIRDQTSFEIVDYGVKPSLLARHEDLVEPDDVISAEVTP